MALVITDQNGNNLAGTSPAQVIVSTPGAAAQVSVFCIAIENDPNLIFQHVEGTLNWNDGSQPVQFGSSPSQLIISASKTLKIGSYLVSVTVQNFRAPTPDAITVVFPLLVMPIVVPPPPAAIVYGPILPQDNGSPSAATWLFNTGYDIAILVSSVKMLLITVPGERVMLPTYGTNVRKLIFEANIASINTLIQTEVSRALAAWEPRVELLSLSSVNDPNNRNVTVTVTLLSKLSQQPFETSVAYSA